MNQTATAARPQQAGAKSAPVMKTYMLLAHTKPTAPIVYQVSPTEAVKLDKLKMHRAYLTSTFMDATGENRTIRLKLNSKSIFLDEQIKAGIPANAKFTQAERNAVTFHYEMLNTNNPVVQAYLEASPQMDGFAGEAPNGEQPLYKLYNRGEEIKTANNEFKLRLKAANKIAGIKTLEEAKELLYKLNGSFYEAPNDLEEAQNELIAYLDNEDNPNSVREILASGSSVDEEARITIAKAIEAKIISFDAIPNFICQWKQNQWYPVKEVNSTEYTPEQRLDYFVEFLTSETGRLLYDDIKARLEKPEANTEEGKGGGAATDIDPNAKA